MGLQNTDRVEHTVTGKRGTVTGADRYGVLIDWDNGEYGVMYYPGTLLAQDASTRMLQKICSHALVN